MVRQQGHTPPLPDLDGARAAVQSQAVSPQSFQEPQCHNRMEDAPMIGNVSAARRRRVSRVVWCAALALLALAGIPGRGAAQGAAPGGSVAGRVTDERGTAVVGADVAIVGGAQSARTGTNGSYVIENVRPGAHTVRARLIGYRGQTASVTVAAGQRATHDFSLAAGPLNPEAGGRARPAPPPTQPPARKAATRLRAPGPNQGGPPRPAPEPQ